MKPQVEAPSASSDLAQATDGSLATWEGDRALRCENQSGGVVIQGTTPATAAAGGTAPGRAGALPNAI